jgi:hypothetical protein
MERSYELISNYMVKIEELLEELKSDFNWLKNISDIEKEFSRNSLPSFVEVVNRLKKLEKHTKSIDEKLSVVASRKID